VNEEKRKILEHLVEYLQDKINTGYHKIFYNDDMYDEKTIDCINAINDTLEENKKLNNIINELEKWLIIQHDIYKNIDIEENTRLSCQYLKVKDKLQELKGSDKE